MSAKANDLNQNHHHILKDSIYTRYYPDQMNGSPHKSARNYFKSNAGVKYQIDASSIFTGLYLLHQKYTQNYFVFTKLKIDYKSWLWFSNFSFAAKSPSADRPRNRATPTTGLEPAKVWIEVKIAYLPRHAKRGRQVELFELQTN